MEGVYGEVFRKGEYRSHQSHGQLQAHPDVKHSITVPVSGKSTLGDLATKSLSTDTFQIASIRPQDVQLKNLA